MHRVGRTGRAGQSGLALTLFTPQDHDFQEELQQALAAQQQQYVAAGAAAAAGAGDVDDSSSSDDGSDDEDGGAGGRAAKRRAADGQVGLGYALLFAHAPVLCTAVSSLRVLCVTCYCLTVAPHGACVVSSRCMCGCFSRCGQPRALGWCHVDSSQWLFERCNGREEAAKRRRQGIWEQSIQLRSHLKTCWPFAALLYVDNIFAMLRTASSQLQ